MSSIGNRPLTPLKTLLSMDLLILGSWAVRADNAPIAFAADRIRETWLEVSENTPYRRRGWRHFSRKMGPGERDATRSTDLTARATRCFSRL